MPPSLRDQGHDLERPSLRRALEPPNPGRQALVKLAQLQEQLGNVLTIVDVQATAHPLYGEEIPSDFKKKFRAFIERLLAIQQRIEEIEDSLRRTIDSPPSESDHLETRHPTNPEQGQPPSHEAQFSSTQPPNDVDVTQTRALPAQPEEVASTQAEIDALKSELSAHEATFNAYKESLPMDVSQQTAEIQNYLNSMERYLDEQRARIDALEQKQKSSQTEPV